MDASKRVAHPTAVVNVYFSVLCMVRGLEIGVEGSRLSGGGDSRKGDSRKGLKEESPPKPSVKPSARRRFEEGWIRVGTW